MSQSARNVPRTPGATYEDEKAPLGNRHLRAPSMHLLSVLLAAFLLLALSGVRTTAQALNRYVPSQYPTIQAAVDAALQGDVIYVAAGVYHDVTHVPPGDNTPCAVIMKSNVILVGTGMGATVIDCEYLGRGIHCAGVTGVRIIGFSIENACAQPGQAYGTGILFRSGAHASVEHCYLRGNIQGGMTCLEGSDPTIMDCVFFENGWWLGNGAGISSMNSAPYVLRCTFTNNRGVTDGLHIAIDGTHRRAKIENCVFQGNPNYYATKGGAIAVLGDSVEVTRSTIRGGLADYGGAISVTGAGSYLLLTHSTLTENSVGEAGGAVYFGPSTVGVLEDCLMVKNRHFANPSITGGSAVCADSAAALSIRQCTIACNRSDGTGRAAMVARHVVVEVERSIVSLNEGTGAIWCSGWEAGFCVRCSDNYWNEGPDEPGCLTLTSEEWLEENPMFCDTLRNDFRLRPGSPLGAGSPLFVQCGQIGSEETGCALVGVAEQAPTRVSAKSLSLHSFPNPFKPPVAIYFQLPRPSDVRIDILDVGGRRVRGLAAGTEDAGAHSVQWDGLADNGIAAGEGVYFCRLRANGFSESTRLLLLR